MDWTRKPFQVRVKRLALMRLRAVTRRGLLLIGIVGIFLWYAARQSIPSNKSIKHLAIQDDSAKVSTHKQAVVRLESNDQRAEAVKEAFIHAWKGYKAFAFKHNELAPVSKSYLDTRFIWGATAVDALTTAILMEMPDIVNDILDHVDHLDFSNTTMKVSIFAATKTFIGGMLSAYDLLSGPKAHLISEPFKVSRLAKQAETLARSLAFAFDTNSGLPHNFVMLRPRPKLSEEISTTDITAAGTLILEWKHLSDLIGDQEYAKLVNRAEDVIFNAFDASGKCKQLFDGLMGKVMSLTTGKFETFNGGYMSGSGSYYEYLIKMYIYSPHEYDAYRQRWIRAVDATIQYLSSNPSTRPDLTFLASYDCHEEHYLTDHTASFAAGNFILGGSVLNKQKYIDFGLQLVESQFAVHQASVTGLSPDRWVWLPKQCKHKPNLKGCRLPPECLSQAKFYTDYGHCVLDSSSRIRPETLESLYYAYRVTRDPKYQDMSWEIFKAINTSARIPSGGFSGISDVNTLPDPHGSSGRVDIMYTWIMGETLKYAWMIHADDDAEWQVGQNGHNKWVFNTQAHPLRTRT